MIALLAPPMELYPVCAHCGEGPDQCECVQPCDFCGLDHWTDELERVDDRYLSHFYRCWDCKKAGA